MTEADPNITLLLGEVRGQLRELIHGMNNQSIKNDAVARQLAKLEGIPDQLSKLEARMTALEQDRYLRDGAMGLGNWLLHSPMIGWLAATGVALWAFLTGRISQ